MSASTSISSSIIKSPLSLPVVKKWFFLEPGGHEPCALTALSLRRTNESFILLEL